LIKISKKELQACCGKKQIIWKLNIPIKKDYLSILQQAGFHYVKTYFDAGMMYIEDKNLIATGIFGLNEITVKCKTKECTDSATKLEQIILTKFN